MHTEDILSSFSSGITGITGDIRGAQIQNSLVGKDIVHHRTLAGRIAGSRATEFIIAVLTLHHEGATTAVRHADEFVESVYRKRKMPLFILGIRLIWNPVFLFKA